MRYFLLLVALAGCGGKGDGLDCSEWLAIRDNYPGPDAGPVYGPDGGVIAISLGNDRLPSTIDPRCFDMYP